MAKLRGVSLFSNCGAGDIGYRESGFDFEVMAELDPRRLSVALANHPGATGVPGDLRTTWKQVVREWNEKRGDERPALLAACPPCQGMSSANSSRGLQSDHEAGGRDPRNLLVTVIAKVAQALKPRAIVVENVQPFLTRAVPNPEDGTPISAALLLTQAVAEDYEVFAMMGDLADWGVPQSRKRAFLTLIRRDEPWLDQAAKLGRTPFPRPTHARDYGDTPVTIRESLSALSPKPLDAGRPSTAADPDDPMHVVPVWDEERYRMVAEIPPYSGRGAWSNERCPSCGVMELDVDAAVCSQCTEPLLRPRVRTKEGNWRLVRGFRSTSYTRMLADAPASTVTTASGHLGSDKTIHPWENRVLSMRECAHLQTLPVDFKWGDALARWGHTNVREMIGEAVPPAFTRAHGQALRAALGVKSRVALLSDSDPRITSAARRLRDAKLKAEEVRLLADRDSLASI